MQNTLGFKWTVSFKGCTVSVEIWVNRLFLEALVVFKVQTRQTAGTLEGGTPYMVTGGKVGQQYINPVLKTRLFMFSLLQQVNAFSAAHKASGHLFAAFSFLSVLKPMMLLCTMQNAHLLQWACSDTLVYTFHWFLPYMGIFHIGALSHCVAI